LYFSTTENSTHYDKLIAAPSDADLLKMWKGWSAITYFGAILTTAVLIPVLASAKCRRNPFNFYLVFLMIPDALVAWSCATACLANALAGHFTSQWSCDLQ
jgi:hypothetical protein